MSGTIEDYQGKWHVVMRQDTLVLEYGGKIEPDITSQISDSYSHNLTQSHRNYAAVVDQNIRLVHSFEKLKELKDHEMIDEQTMIETMKQQVYLEDNRDKITLDRGYVVASGEQLFFGDTHEEAVKKAREAVGKKPYYSESIGLIDFPSPLFHEGD